MAIVISRLFVCLLFLVRADCVMIWTWDDIVLTSDTGINLQSSVCVEALPCLCIQSWSVFFDVHVWSDLVLVERLGLHNFFSRKDNSRTIVDFHAVFRSSEVEYDRLSNRSTHLVTVSSHPPGPSENFQDKKITPNFFSNKNMCFQKQHFSRFPVSGSSCRTSPRPRPREGLRRCPPPRCCFTPPWIQRMLGKPHQNPDFEGKSEGQTCNMQQKHAKKHRSFDRENGWLNCEPFYLLYVFLIGLP